MMDRISSLPDEIVSHVLSFLSVKEAALTSVLAKRWRNLFAFSPNLCLVSPILCYVSEGVNMDSFIEFVDRVLAVSGSSLIKQFTLEQHWYCAADPVFFNRWLCNVLTRGVSELHLSLVGAGKYTLPSELFSCKTLVKLKLGRYFDVVVIPENASLPALKSLFLERIRFSSHHGCYTFEALVSACPLLEELVIDDIDFFDKDYKRWHWTVSSPTLERLTVRCTSSNVLFHSRSITFDTPRLAYFEYFGDLPDAHSVVNFDSVVEAQLSLLTTMDDCYDCNPTNLLQSLRNVEILDLRCYRTMEYIYCFQEAIPVFKKLHHLTISTFTNNSWQTLLLLLKNSPNLETLVIDGLLHCDGNEESDSLAYSCLSSCPVKVLDITLCREETILELNQLKHVLEKLPCLELVKVTKVCSYATELKEQTQLNKDILNLPRSSKCKIQFEFMIR